MTNYLIHEKSPYLLGHARNPVDWHPWGDEAFDKARRENKPVFLSIGYATCHWCHVMERESFEDEETARLLNDVFICIKVDREERPDIDSVYMKVCQLMTKSGGWPLTIIMTPDKKPFFAATYIPRETRYGRIGLQELIPRIKTLWQTRNAELKANAAEITQALETIKQKTPPQQLSKKTLDKAYEYFLQSFDRVHGGFGGAPKFPTPHNLYFLMRYYHRGKKDSALQMVEKTLQGMRRGGIFDQIGFGFHRYSTDERWIVPHFEKMLYDQALLALAYLEAYQLTRKEEYARTAREIFTYVLRDMTDEQGGFYCAEDADSEGVEGKFYLWTQEEIKNILPPGEASLFLSLYQHPEDREIHGMQEMPRGHFIPHLVPDSGEIPILTDKIRQKLFAARETRVHPLKDDKILADWNGLMIAALAKGAQILDEPLYLKAARNAADFIFTNMTDEQGELLHRWRAGDASIAGMLDDYAFVIWGLLELYEASWQTKYLEFALRLNRQMMERYWDEKEGGLYFTQHEGEDILVRQKEAQDGALPSGNSVALLNLLRLARITANSELENRAAKIAEVFSAQVAQHPTAHTQLLAALDFSLG
ncbi:MAG TPA: thioredoxin domain-containing protein, partial [Deltaproteobacteria bacterium]|nr:thioredoxin domain-containing protein [Deltaproteobacteria bacterium]